MLPSNGPVRPARSRLFWPVFTLVILVAFWLHFYRLADQPLGIYFDPAIDGLDAIRLMQRGGHTLFFPTNGGRESPFVYLLVPFIWLFGTEPFTIRFVVATAGLFTIVLLFGMLYDLRRFIIYPRWPWLSPAVSDPESAVASGGLWLAGLAALALGVSYWHIVISRLGQRPILVPLLSVPLFWFFLKGWYTSRRRWFILAGLFMGLEGYTYSAARLLPVILVLALLPELIIYLYTCWHNSKGTKGSQAVLSIPGGGRPSAACPIEGRVGGRSRLAGNLLAFGLAAALVYLPMAWTMLTHPAYFTARAFSVMVWNFLDTPPAIAAEVSRNGLRILGFFCCAGSPNPIFGLPGQPGLSPLLAPLLLAGLVGAVLRWRSLFDRLVVLWWLVGVMGSALAIEAPHPWRMVVGVVPTAILVALAPVYMVQVPVISHVFHLVLRGAFFVGRTLPSLSFIRITTPISENAPFDTTRKTQYAYWTTLLLILATIPTTFYAYYLKWPTLPVTRGIYDYGAIAIRDEIQRRAGESQPIYLPLGRLNDSTLLYYLGGTYGRQAALTAPPAAGALIISPEKHFTDTTWVRLQDKLITVLPPLSPEGQRQIEAALASNTAVPIQAVGGEIAAHLARLGADPAGFVQQPTDPITATFGPARLVGATYPETIDPARDSLPVTLFWQADRPITEEYEVLLHLVDDSRQARGNGDARPTDWVYPTTFWRPGLDTLGAGQAVHYQPGTLPPGRYWLALSLFDPTQGRRLPLTAGGGDSPDTLFLGPLKVALARPEPALTAVEGLNVTFGETIRLAGVAAGEFTVASGQPLDLTLVWEALSRPALDYTVFVHLLDQQGNLVTGSDTQPLAGGYPTTIWTPGERIADRRTLPTRDGQGQALPPGRYSLAVGLYYQPTGERLPLRWPDGRVDPQGSLVLARPLIVTPVH